MPGCARGARTCSTGCCFDLTTSLGFDLPRAVLTVALVARGRPRRARSRCAAPRDAPPSTSRSCSPAARRRRGGRALMRVLLLGTGVGRRLAERVLHVRVVHAGRAPAPRSARTTSALVDDVLLLDCGPDTPRRRARAGRRPRRRARRAAHPRAPRPPGTRLALLARSWARSPAHPCSWSGRRRAVDACRALGRARRPGDPERRRAGRRARARGVRRARAARRRTTSASTRSPADAVLYDVTAPDGGRLLYATDTGPLPRRHGRGGARTRRSTSCCSRRPSATHADHGTGHLDLATFPVELARLRAVGAVDDATDVVAVHLGHHNPPGTSSPRGSARGARACCPTSPRSLDAGDVAAPRAPSRDAAWSSAARARASRARPSARWLAEPHVHLRRHRGRPATATPSGPRASRLHRERRPAAWTTVETLDVARRPRPAPAPTTASSSTASRCGSPAAWTRRAPGTPSPGRRRTPRRSVASSATCDRLVGARCATTSRPGRAREQRGRQRRGARARRRAGSTATCSARSTPASPPSATRCRSSSPGGCCTL